MEKTKTTGALIWSDRWRLGALSHSELVNIGFASVLIGFLFILFHLFGNTVENVHSNSAFVFMVNRWQGDVSYGVTAQGEGADYSHGFLIPIVSVWVIWSRRQVLVDAPKKICTLGLGVIVMALMMHWLGAKMQQTRISLMALILLLWGIPYYFFGWKVAKQLIFPCAYLIFCVPLNFLDALSGPLQTIAVKWGYAAVNGMGIECEKVGNMLISPYFQLNVEKACSGLRSLLAMTALTAVYANQTQKGFFKQWMLFASSIPIAVIGNVGRIISIALVSITTGQSFGAGLHHDWAGYVFFSVAISLMVAFGKLLNVNYKELFKSWKEVYLSHS